MSEATTMKPETRRSHYSKQNNGQPMSNRQRRRYERKREIYESNLKKINKVKAATFKNQPKGEPVSLNKPAPVYDEISDTVMDNIGDGTFPETEETPARPCGGTDHCITPKGAKAKATHKKCQGVAA